MSAGEVLHLSAAQVRAALRTRFPPREFALMFEVSNAAGFERCTSADAVAMNLWPSRGLEVHGIEIKVSRGDWKRELAKPDKAQQVQRYCDRWWVAAPVGVVPRDQLPPTWGLLEVNAKLATRAVVDAPKLQPMDLDRGFIACMLRRASEVDQAEVNVLVNAAVAAEREQIDKRIADGIAARTRASADVVGKLDEIKALTGVDLKTWKAPAEVAAVIKAVLDGNVLSAYGPIESALSAAHEFVKAATPLLDLLAKPDDAKKRLRSA